MSKSSADLRSAELRPFRIGAPDTRRPHFVAECRRQSALAAAADRADRDLMTFVDAAWIDFRESGSG